jgi:hypothetical protein
MVQRQESSMEDKTTRISAELMAIIDAVAEAGTCLRIAALKAIENREPELKRLEHATAEARKLADAYMARGTMLHDRIRIELRMCEIGLEKMRLHSQSVMS